MHRWKVRHHPSEPVWEAYDPFDRTTDPKPFSSHRNAFAYAHVNANPYRPFIP